MTPDQLRHHRGDRTRDEFAEFLGCSASAIVQWEGGKRTIPDWVEEKVLRSIELTLPIEELHALLDYARKHNKSFTQILGEAIRAHIGVKRYDTPSQPQNVLPLPAQEAGPKVAEDEPVKRKASDKVEVSLKASDEDYALLKAGAQAKRARQALETEGRTGPAKPNA